MNNRFYHLITYFPSKPIRRIIWDYFGEDSYNCIKEKLKSINMEYMLEVLYDAMFISGTKFFPSLYSYSIESFIDDIKLTTPTIYYILFTWLSEYEIRTYFHMFKNNELSNRCFRDDHIDKVVNSKTKQEFISNAMEYIPYGITVTELRQQREKEVNEARIQQSKNGLIMKNIQI